MRKISTFQDLKVWQKSHQLTLQIYKITEKFPKIEIYGLANQIRRAAVSVASNIVEGFERRGTKDGLHFYNIADGSLEEVKCQLFLAIVNLAEEVSKMLNSWIKSQLKILK